MAEALWGLARPSLAGSNFLGMHLQTAEVLGMGKVKQESRSALPHNHAVLTARKKGEEKKIRTSEHRKETK